MNRRSRISFGPGAASLILIVVVLSMSVLGILALMNARNDSRLSQRSMQVIEAGYALSAKAEHTLAGLDETAAKCADSAADDAAYAEAVRRALPAGMTLDDDRVIAWTETDGARTLECAVALAPLGEGTRLNWTKHRLTAATEDAWNN